MSNLLWGIVLVVLGIIFGLNALDITNINIFFRGWWCFIIIIPSFIGLFKSKERMSNVIGLIIGILLFLSCRNIISFDIVWKLLVPIILVLVGLSLIFKDAISGKVKEEIKKLDKEKDDNEHYATFSGQRLDYSKEEFVGTELNAVFGLITCDLRETKIKKDVVIKTSSIFGGINIIVPKDINVKVTSTSIFGGVGDERRYKCKDGKITLYIDATCMFGGVDINDKDPEDN